jgi:uncharacterized membrane protein YkvI
MTKSIRVFVTCYLALSILTVVAVILLRDHADLVTPAVWGRASVVVLAALLMTSFVVRAGRGSARAFRRLRLVSAIMLVAIVVIVAIPGDFPLWFKAEQAVCGLLVLSVVVQVNRPAARAVGRDRATATRQG